MTLRYIYTGNDNPPGVLIRVDANKEVALGHLKRCISLSCKLREKGAAVSFLTVNDDYTEKSLKKQGFDYAFLEPGTNQADDCSFTLETAGRLGAKIVVIDSYDLDSAYRKRLMNGGIFTVSIDDTAEKEIPSNVIVNGNLNAENLRYSNDGETLLYLGIKYLILGPDFWSLNGPKAIVGIENVLITMGGIDHYNLTTRIMAVLDGIDLDFDINAIVGPYYENIDSIRKQAGKMKKKVNIVNSPPSLYPYMKKCSMAFSAGGQTLYELAALGCPTIGITIWENQTGNVAELSKMGAIAGIIYTEDKGFDNKLRESTSRLVHDRTERQKLSQIASSLVDGKGAERAANAILDAYTRWSFNHR